MPTEEEELKALIEEGLASKEISEDEFWHVVNDQIDTMLSDYSRAKGSARSK